MSCRIKQDRCKVWVIGVLRSPITWPVVSTSVTKEQRDLRESGETYEQNLVHSERRKITIGQALNFHDQHKITTATKIRLHGSWPDLPPVLVTYNWLFTYIFVYLYSLSPPRTLVDWNSQRWASDTVKKGDQTHTDNVESPVLLSSKSGGGEVGTVECSKDKVKREVESRNFFFF